LLVKVGLLGKVVTEQPVVIIRVALVEVLVPPLDGYSVRDCL
jgi:hypothetical protein